MDNNYPTLNTKFAKHTALSDSSSSLSFSQAQELISYARSNLAKMGIKYGSRVALLAQNSIHFALLTQAIQQLGASAALLNCRLLPDDWKSQIIASKAKLLVCDANYLEHNLASEQVLLKNLFETPTRINSKIHPFEAKREAVIIFTSGSSGHTKGVRLSLGNFAASATASNNITNLRPGDCWLISLPMYHLAGLGAINRTLYAGANAELISSFLDAEIGKTLKHKHITHLSLVPTQLEALIANCDKTVLKKLKAIILAGAPSSDRLLEDIKRLKLPVLSAYGMTETTAHCTCMRLDDSLDKISGVGRPFANTKVEVVDASKQTLSPGNIGEIRFSGPTICLGYLQENLKLAVEDEWLYSGDLGVFDSAGNLRITGRKDDMFISGGENIHPGEIEQAALTYPDVLQAAVLAVDDEKWGKRPVLFVQMRLAKSHREKLTKHLESKLAKIKVPDTIVEIEQMPKTAIGKNDYQALRRQI